MQDVLYIEIPLMRRTFILSGFSELWKSSQQSTICDTLQAKVNQDSSIDVEAHFESNGGITIAFVNTPMAIVWS